MRSITIKSNGYVFIIHSHSAKPTIKRFNMHTAFYFLSVIILKICSNDQRVYYYVYHSTVRYNSSHFNGKNY